MEINFLHKTESTTNTNHLCDWPTVKDMDILFDALSIFFMVQTSQYLQRQAEERFEKIFKGEHGVQKVCQPLQVRKILLMTCSRLL